MQDSIVFDQIIFDNKSFGDIIRDAYNNRTLRNNQIDAFIEQLKTLIKSPNDAAILVPFVKEYLDIAVKNDDNVIKLASIIQRALSRTGSQLGNNGSLFDDDELKALTANLNPTEQSELINVVNTQVTINNKLKNTQSVLQSAEDLIDELTER